MLEYDVIIVGAGIVGLTGAAMLSETDLKIAIVDQQALSSRLEPEVDARVYAIYQAAQAVFVKNGVWSSILHRASPIRQMEIGDINGFGKVYFDSSEIGLAYLGHIIEHQVMMAALYQHLSLKPNFVWYTEKSLEQLTLTEQDATLALNDGIILKAKLLIAADGAQSWVRQQIKPSMLEQDYGQQALVSTITTAKPHQQIAYQRFLSDGPLALLPLMAPHQSSIVWSSTPEHIQELSSLDEQAFCSALSKAACYRLGEVLTASTRHTHPLVKRHLNHYVQARLAFIGDAAHTIHPLAGQGLNLGILDAASLGKVIKAAWNKHRDIGVLATLRPYERERRSHNLAMLALMDILKQMFSLKHPLLCQLRDSSLFITEQTRLLKNAMMRWAIGES